MNRRALCLDVHHIYTLIVGFMLMRWFTRFCFRVVIRKSRHCQGFTCLYACNHRSFYDPPLATMFLNTPVSYMARRSLWPVPIIGWMLRGSNALPVDRDEPHLSIMKRAVAMLKEGTSLCIFPEGTRSRDGRMQAFREGPALFSRRAGVPVVPIFVHNTDIAWAPGRFLPALGSCRLHLRIGRAFRAPAHLPPRLQDRFVMTYLRRWMERQERELTGKSGRAKPLPSSL